MALSDIISRLVMETLLLTTSTMSGWTNVTGTGPDSGPITMSLTSVGETFTAALASVVAAATHLTVDLLRVLFYTGTH